MQRDVSVTGSLTHVKEHKSVRLVVERVNVTGMVHQELLEAFLLQQSDYQPHNINKVERSVTQQQSTVLEESGSLFCVKQRLLRGV